MALCTLPTLAAGACPLCWSDSGDPALADATWAAGAVLVVTVYGVLGVLLWRLRRWIVGGRR